MRNAIILVAAWMLFSLSSAPALGTDSWVELASSQNGEIKSYLDTDSFEQMGTETWGVWLKYQYSQPRRDSFFSSAYITDQRRMIVNCKSRTMATAQRNRLDQTGAPVNQERWEESKWAFSSVGPRGGTNHTEFQGICSLAQLKLRRFNFSRAGQWVNVAPGFAVDPTSSLRAPPLIYYRSISTDFEQRRVNDKKLVATVSYTIHDCDRKVFSIYGLGNLGEGDEILSSFLVASENLQFSNVVQGAISSFVQEKYCVSSTAIGNTATPSNVSATEGNSRESIRAEPKRLDAHALVIGNSEYSGTNRLTNPENDAQAMAGRLRSFGFIVTLVLNANRDQLVSAFAKFSQSAAGADLSLLFYAGHGIQVSGTNYMIPTDLDFRDVSKAPLQGVSMNDVVDRYLPGKAKLVFLDACRENPLMQVAGRGMTRGLAPINVAEGTLIAYATKDGQVAEDGQGRRNSPFTTALLEHLSDPDDIAVVLRKVREKVMKATGGRQQPWEYGSLTGGQLVLSTVRPSTK
jgi:hypothetical protein